MNSTLNPTPNQTTARRASAQPHTCSCADPFPVERAERKSAAVVDCLHCGLRVPARLR